MAEIDTPAYTPGRPPLRTPFRTPRRATSAAFALNGLLLGGWASRVPAVVEKHGLSESGFGLLLLVMGVGALVSFPLAGRLADGFGAVRLTRWIIAFYLSTLILIGLAPGAAWLGVALFLFGMCHGAMDVAMNSWASEVEKHLRRSIMSSFHAMWSLGAGLGAASGFAATSFDLSIAGHFAILALLAALLLAPMTLCKWTSATRAHDRNSPVFALPRGPLVLVGVIALSAGLGEGALADWSAIFLRDVAGSGEAQATLGYAAFSVTMVAMRLGVDPLITRLGPTVVARCGGLAAALGIAIATGVATLPAALLGFVLMGVGYAALVPLAFSRAAADPIVPPGQGIASVATLGYGAMLLGPPVIGFVAEVSSLRIAFMLLGGFALLIALIAPVLQRDVTRTAT
ncbi:MFS transporter [Pseudooceanicola sediminis]|uniref:MFS transporter n=1 Tax=Pseudooceanicola sediminis TaxID=2211117 RepID=A0A399IZ61_9RHOB|nr:MFS transporter [Pseudooceanicola sediminis]KAA2313431.1 MFS transporter [Puniceibacterium sp. HSS470]RII38290.1 MFS transporter [Pseudooceanicola sediminis]|tara:strand:+ start:13503 stop:14705 length:1203 start_codon:yes stop_codon:yes gene_type:complete